MWAAVLNKNLLSSLSLFLYINLPSTNSVSSSAMRHTVICACVLLCVCVCAVQWLSFWQAAVYWSTSQRNRTIIELLKNTLISLWNTLAFSLLTLSLLSLSVFLSLSTHTHSHTQCRMHLQIVLLLCRGWPVKTLQTLSRILLYFFFKKQNY